MTAPAAVNVNAVVSASAVVSVAENNMPTVVEQLTDQAGRGDVPQDNRTAWWYRVVTYGLPVIFMAALIIPAYTYFVVSHAQDQLFGNGIEAGTRFLVLFRLFGLYAFTFLWGQIVFGPFMQPLGRMYGKSWFYFHRAEALFALLLATLHPVLFYVAYGMILHSFPLLSAIPNYTPLILFAYLGPVAWTLMIVTVATALLMRKPWLQKRWRWVHLFNYVIFLLVLIHSFAIGTDIKQEPMFALYVVFVVTFIAAVGYRRIYRPLAGRDNLPQWAMTWSKQAV